jgi:hypothetical protein
MGEALGQVNAVGHQPCREASIGARQQHQAAAPRDLGEPPARRQGLRRAEGPEDHARASRQGGCRTSRVGRAPWVGEEEEPRQGLPP